MIRYILVDDDQRILETVKSKIDALSKDYGLQHVKSYHSSKTAYETINSEDFDLLIVDFEMPVYNGIELAQKIAEHKKIIFLTSTTNNEQQVINNLDISGYLSKPFDIDEFKTILKHKVFGKITSNSTNNKITLSIGTNRDIRFTPEQVYYISSKKTTSKQNKQPDKNCVHIYGKQDQIIYKNVRITIKELHKTLANHNFEKIRQSTIINMAHVKERDNTHISIFDCNETFEITATEKSSFIAKLRAKLSFR